MAFSQSLMIPTRGRATLEITDEVEGIVQSSGVLTGLANVFVHHTSASLIVCENADPTVRADLERFLSSIAPDGDPSYRHRDEGPDDMPAHLRSILTSSSINLPVNRGKLDLGTWQGIYLYEHRTAAHRRRITVTILG